MLKLTVLGSGSRGNALVVDTGSTAIVVDAGFGCRALERRLHHAGYRAESIAALVLTHEHVDHAQGALPAARRWQWPIYASAGTSAAMCDSAGSSADQIAFRLLTDAGCNIDTLTIRSHAVAHDAADPVGLTIEETVTGARLGIAIDLGYAPASLTSAFCDLDLLVVEANHDTEMLRVGPYPASLKRRIASRHGHLSNSAAGDFVAACAHGGLRQVVLAHLSETNNNPDVAIKAVSRVLATRGRTHARVDAANQRTVTGPFVAGTSARRSRVPVQLQLAI